MKERKISFLIAAHNEEKIIAKTLENLINLPYKNYEIIVGLDGCTDNSEEIVRSFCKKSRKIRYYKLNLRQGKPAVINRIITKASGDIIIINDADWIFKVNDKKTFEKFLSVFNNPKIGGIGESFPVEWKNDGLKKSNWGYKMVAYSSYFWLKFQKENFTYKKNNVLILKEPTMFLTNIFRKSLYKNNYSLGDDFERTRDIMGADYNVVLHNDLSAPRMIAIYDRIPIKDLFKQKIRTAIAREQLKNRQKINVKNYYSPVIRYMLKNSLKEGVHIFSIICFWIILNSIATLIAKFKDKDTKKGWKLRIKR